MAFVEVTKKDHIAVVTMNRPEALNALNKAVFTDLEVALDDVEKDDEVYVVIITGAGRAFIAGADIGEMAPMNVAEGLAFSELGNRILFPMINEAIIVLENGIASKEDIDTAMMYGANHKMGPLALADLVGLDICLAIMETIFTETGDSKYRPALTMKKMVRAGLLGQKTGEGFYKY